MTRLAWACLSLLLACGPTQAPLPLQAPLPASRTLPSGLQVVLTDADLPAMARTARTLAGPGPQLTSPAWPVPGVPGHDLQPLAVTLPVADAQAAWVQPTQLRFVYEVAPISLPLVFGAPGQAACALTWTGKGGQALVTLRVSRDAQGHVAAVAAEPPVLTWTSHGLADAQACLPVQATQAPAQIDAHLLDLLQATLLPPLVTASRAVVQAAFPAGLELQGRLPTTTRWGDAVEVRAQTTFVDQGEALALHAGDRTVATLALGLDVDRAACAIDVPPPQDVGVPLPLQLPDAPAGTAFARRALVLDHATLAWLGWAMGRGGVLCQDTRADLTGLPPTWAQDVLPALAPWLEGPPVGARFWPEASPGVAVIDTPAGPALQWTVAMATLEIVARVAGTDLVVLRIHGPMQAIARPLLQGGALGLEVLSAQPAGPLTVNSPLLNLAGADDHAGPLVDAALRGIFRVPPVLPLGLALPAGTVATGLSRSGDALWLWLEGGLGP